jgi:hypothetical protein
MTQINEILRILEGIGSELGNETAKKLIGLAGQIGKTPYLFSKASYTLMEQVSKTDVVDETGSVVATVTDPTAFFETIYLDEGGRFDTSQHRYSMVEKLPVEEIDALYKIRDLIQGDLENILQAWAHYSAIATSINAKGLSKEDLTSLLKDALLG